MEYAGVVIASLKEIRLRAQAAACDHRRAVEELQVAVAEAVATRMRSLQRREATAKSRAALYGSACQLAFHMDPTLPNDSGPAVLDTLTEREKQIILLIADDLSSKQIAYRLGITQKTVEFHTQTIKRKLRVGRVGIVRYAIRAGLLNP